MKTPERAGPCGHIVREGKHVADLYVALELKSLIEERHALRRNLLMATVAASLGAAAIGFLIVHRMVQPLRLLTERLRRAQAGDFERVSPVHAPSGIERVWPPAAGL